MSRRRQIDASAFGDTCQLNRNGRRAAGHLIGRSLPFPAPWLAMAGALLFAPQNPRDAVKTLGDYASQIAGTPWFYLVGLGHSAVNVGRIRCSHSQLTIYRPLLFLRPALNFAWKGE
jgi:hypothetical protein